MATSRFPHLWVILYRVNPEDDFQIHSEYPTRSRARSECQSLIREWVGKGNAYVQKYGPYQ